MNGLMRRASLVKSFGSQWVGDDEGDFAKFGLENWINWCWGKEY